MRKMLSWLVLVVMSLCLTVGSGCSDSPSPAVRTDECSTPNVCGGCEELSGDPGEECGPCGDGVQLCVSPNEIGCTGQSEASACANNDPNNEPNNTSNNTPNNDPNNDPNNGLCGEGCGEGEVCEEGQCVCDPGQHDGDDLNCGCEGPCEDGRSCVEGECRWPCELDGCEESPSRCEGNTLVEGGAGRCDVVTGACDYSEVESRTDCLAESQVCQEGACVDLCAQVVCEPQAGCEGEVLVEYLEEGVCDIESGQCGYDNQEARRTDCRGDFDFTCVEGACVCLAEEHQSDDLNCGCEGACAEGRSCVEGACRWPCELEGCPSLGNACDGNTLVEVPAAGRCDVEAGRCDYSEVESRTDCLAESQVCQEGACVDLCAQVVCEPQRGCEGEVLVVYLEEGVCDIESGQCGYDNQEARRTDCREAFDFACVEGACVCLAEEHQSDDLNCGCEGPCADDYTCVEGSCEAPPLETCQGDVCVATTVLVPAGPFIMGPHDNTPQQEVTLTRSYLIQQTEVTQGQYEDLMGDNPSWFGPNGIGADCGSDCPVEEVSWFDAVAYCNALSMRDGFQPCHDAEGNLIGGETVYACEGWRLPTHAEWEKAARGTDGRTYPWGEDRPSCSLAIISNGCFRESTWPVASRDQGVSPYVLYDMTGNVSEWTWDGDYELGQLGTDPVGDTGGECRGSRGGSYYNGAFGNPKNVEIARRSCSLTSGSRTRGFRCVRSN